MSTTLAVSEFRKDIADIVDRVNFGGERVVVKKNGKNVAALISYEDYNLFERLLDARDVLEAERRLSDPTDKVIPFKRST